MHEGVSIDWKLMLNVNRTLRTDQGGEIRFHADGEVSRMPAYRNFTKLIALAQILIVLGGFVGTVLVFSASGYPHAPFRWNRLALMLREHGIWLLVVPLLWTLLSTRLQHRLVEETFYQAWHLFGMALAAGLLGLFLYASVFPFTVPLWIQRP